MPHTNASRVPVNKVDDGFLAAPAMHPSSPNMADVDMGDIPIGYDGASDGQIQHASRSGSAEPSNTAHTTIDVIGRAVMSPDPVQREQGSLRPGSPPTSSTSTTIADNEGEYNKIALLWATSITDHGYFCKCATAPDCWKLPEIMDSLRTYVRETNKTGAYWPFELPGAGDDRTMERLLAGRMLTVTEELRTQNFHSPWQKLERYETGLACAALVLGVGGIDEDPPVDEGVRQCVRNIERYARAARRLSMLKLVRRPEVEIDQCRQWLRNREHVIDRKLGHLMHRVWDVGCW